MSAISSHQVISDETETAEFDADGVNPRVWDEYVEPVGAGDYYVAGAKDLMLIAGAYRASDDKAREVIHNIRGRRPILVPNQKTIRNKGEVLELPTWLFRELEDDGEAACIHSETFWALQKQHLELRKAARVKPSKASASQGTKPADQSAKSTFARAKATGPYVGPSGIKRESKTKNAKKKRSRSR